MCRAYRRRCSSDRTRRPAPLRPPTPSPTHRAPWRHRIGIHLARHHAMPPTATTHGHRPKPPPKPRRNRRRNGTGPGAGAPGPVVVVLLAAAAAGQLLAERGERLVRGERTAGLLGRLRGVRPAGRRTLLAGCLGVGL